MKKYLSMTGRLYRILIFCVMPLLGIFLLCLEFSLISLKIEVLNVPKLWEITFFCWIYVPVLDILAEKSFLSGICRRGGMRLTSFMVSNKGDRMLKTAIRINSVRIILWNLLIWGIHVFMVGERIRTENLALLLWNYMLVMDLISLAGGLFARIFDISSNYTICAACLLIPFYQFVLERNLEKMGSPLILALLLALLAACVVSQEVLLEQSLKRRFYDE